ncbi:fimbrillin family protein [Odoribacter sp. OttesenSCG-928-J03]|nr:fimbrillin family protein [Odoribacter sp. OttesenSCG-928-J03]MDL2330617.1 fimbrillin family protein [Odoribacter sp. OttesenSCG-928-A06]
MKRLYKYILSVILLSLTFTGCHNNELTDASSKQEQVQLLVSVSGVKSKVNVAGNAFENKDRFKFFFNLDKPDNGPASEGIADSSPKRTEYTYNSGKWTPLAPIYWDNYQMVNRDFCAIVMFCDQANDYSLGNYNLENHQFSVEWNQANQDNYREAYFYNKSDLMMARVATSERLIPVVFSHIMSRVTVAVTATTDTTNKGYFIPNDIKSMKVLINGVQATGQLTYNTPSSTDPAIAVSGMGTSGNITMFCATKPTYSVAKQTITATYYAIFPPQVYNTLSNPLLTLVVTDSENTEKQYYLTVDNNLTFQQGKNLSINVTLTKNGVKIKEDVSIESGDWYTTPITIDDDESTIGLK